jgi:CheB methylesterase
MTAFRSGSEGSNSTDAQPRPSPDHRSGPSNRESDGKASTSGSGVRHLIADLAGRAPPAAGPAISLLRRGSWTPQMWSTEPVGQPGQPQPRMWAGGPPGDGCRWGHAGPMGGGAGCLHRWAGRDQPGAGHAAGQLPRRDRGVQHTTPTHPSQLAEILSRRTALKVTLAQDGDRLQPGLVLVAPAGRHILVCPDQTVALINSGQMPPWRPSADLLLTSMALSCGAHAVAVILSGAGHDGTAGAAA